MPNASHARPCASPKSGCRCEWNSISPGITVRFAASTTWPPACLPPACGDDARDPVAVDDDVDVRARRRRSSCRRSLPACTTMRPVGIAGVYFRSSGTVRSRRSRCRRSAACPATDRGCAASRPAQLGECALSVVTRRGGPSGSPAGAPATPPSDAFVDRGHLRAVGRPHRAAAAARVDRQHRHRRVPLSSAAAGRPRSSAPGSCPRGSACVSGATAASAIRVPSGDHVGVARLRQRVVHLRHRAAGDVEHRHLRDAPHAVDVEERDALAVRRPRGALRLRRQVRDLPAAARSACRGSRAAGARCPCPTSTRAARRRATTPDRCRAPRRW